MQADIYTASMFGTHQNPTPIYIWVSIIMQHSQLNQKMTGYTMDLHYFRQLPMQKQNEMVS